MLTGLGDLDARDLEVGKTTILHFAVKSQAGGLFLDARKWIKYPNCDEFRATIKGLSTGLSDWKRAIPLIQELIASAEGKSIK